MPAKPSALYYRGVLILSENCLNEKQQQQQQQQHTLLKEEEAEEEEEENERINLKKLVLHENAQTRSALKAEVM